MSILIAILKNAFFKDGLYNDVYEHLGDSSLTSTFLRAILGSMTSLSLYKIVNSKLDSRKKAMMQGD